MGTNSRSKDDWWTGSCWFCTFATRRRASSRQVDEHTASSNVRRHSTIALQTSPSDAQFSGASWQQVTVNNSPMARTVFAPLREDATSSTKQEVHNVFHCPTENFFKFRLWFLGDRLCYRKVRCLSCLSVCLSCLWHWCIVAKRLDESRWNLKFLRKVANRQTDRQTNNDDYISSLAEAMKWAYRQLPV